MHFAPSGKNKLPGVGIILHTNELLIALYLFIIHLTGHNDGTSFAL
jgi:hypothetical protein